MKEGLYMFTSESPVDFLLEVGGNPKFTFKKWYKIRSVTRQLSVTTIGETKVYIVTDDRHRIRTLTDAEFDLYFISKEKYRNSLINLLIND